MRLLVDVIVDVVVVDVAFALDVTIVIGWWFGVQTHFNVKPSSVELS